MKTKHAATAAFLSLCSVYATEVTWSGSIDADAIRNFGDKRGDETNQELTLGTHVAFDEKISLDLAFAASNGSAPDGDGAPEERWSSVDFDGFLLNMQVRESLSLHAGDHVYAEGSFRYFAYHSTGTYSATFTDTPLRGASLEWNGLEAAVGTSDISAHITNGYLTYAVEFSPLTIRPYALVQVSADYDTLTRVGGIAGAVTWGDNFIDANVSYLQEKNGDPTFTLLVEPQFFLGSLRFDLTGFYAYLPHKPATIGVPDEWLVYGEPQIQLHPWFRLGLSGELHDIDQNPEQTQLWTRTLIQGHITPHEQATILLFGGKAWAEDLAFWQIGGEVLAEF